MKVKKRILIALAGVMVLGMSGTKSVPMMASETGDPDFMISIPAELTIQKSGWDEVGEIIMRMPPSKYIKIKTDKEWGNGKLVNKDDTTKIIPYQLRYQPFPGANLQPFGTGEFHSSTEYRITIHVNVEEYSNMPPGIYEDIVTFTAYLMEQPQA